MRTLYPKFIPPSTYTASTDQALCLDGSLMREPTFHLKEEKPNGLVKIEWNHPMTKDLSVYLLMDRFPLRELTRGGIGTNNGGVPVTNKSLDFAGYDSG